MGVGLNVEIMEVTDFTLLTRIVQRKGQSGRKLFPPAGLRKELNACLSLWGL